MSEGITYPEILGHVTEDEAHLNDIRQRAQAFEPEADTTAQAERDRTWLLGLVNRLLRGEHTPSIAFTKMEPVSPELSAKAQPG